MASLSTLLKPISESSYLRAQVSHYLPNSSLSSRKISFSGTGSGRFQLGIVVRSSNRDETIVVSTQQSDVPLLSCSEAIERLKINREKFKGKQQFPAMYSSIFGGITTDPSAMVIPLDDHMVHRGHGVFDTAAIMDGLVIIASQKGSLLLVSGTPRQSSGSLLVFSWLLGAVILVATLLCTSWSLSLPLASVSPSSVSSQFSTVSCLLLRRRLCIRCHCGLFVVSWFVVSFSDVVSVSPVSSPFVVSALVVVVVSRTLLLPLSVVSRLGLVSFLIL
ncbi:uncharacterized protein LOC131147150 [Malania oleifera]|uniref:uncharacterized protein LOC131147150 n=1 Tax=Malania oleifera TaxID=397392 RepID=UPI0025AE95B3|nr:uncharacterized protein LOC131147150 [Malania oleifera]